ncbi:hypothetical protein FLONG3_7236 [Fusarium longipes]|uniref:CCHC-type domain-containing protein n=1 Tax=Fusarium longipes TaxID=694270 RepID=A0A395SFD7_9HYPO|nr:hypothetical protein FLONG3_7236 [Fusarium longipes]
MSFALLRLREGEGAACTSFSRRAQFASPTHSFSLRAQFASPTHSFSLRAQLASPTHSFSLRAQLASTASVPSGRARAPKRCNFCNRHGHFQSACPKFLHQQQLEADNIELLTLYSALAAKTGRQTLTRAPPSSSATSATTPQPRFVPVAAPVEKDKEKEKQ